MAREPRVGHPCSREKEAGKTFDRLQVLVIRNAWCGRVCRLGSDNISMRGIAWKSIPFLLCLVTIKGFL